MSEAEGELVESAFFFGSRLEAYLRDTAKVRGDFVARLRTLIEIADGETILTDGDADKDAWYRAHQPDMSDELRRGFVEATSGRQAEDRAQAAMLVDLLHARVVLAEILSLQDDPPA